MVNSAIVVYVDDKLLAFLREKRKEGFKVSSYIKRLISQEMEKGGTK